MSLKEILERNPNLTLADLQELQREYDKQFIEVRFSGDAKVSHTYAHMGKLLGRLATYVEAFEEGDEPSPEDIREKVVPDLLVYSAWLANELGVDMEQAYLTRFVGNLRRLYAHKLSQKELEELEKLVQERFNKPSKS